MAGTYATDLIHLWTTQNATGTTGGGSNIVEMTGYTAGGGNNRINGDGDLYLSGGSSLTTNGQTGAGGVSLVLNYVADGRTQVTAVAGSVFAFWSFFPTPTAVETVSNTFAGEQICIGSAPGTYRSYTVGGRDVDLYGGWNHRTLDPRNSTTGDARGTYTANNPNHVGFLYEQAVTLRRPPVLGLDNIRYGRHTLTCTGGTLASIDNVNPLSSSAANFSQAADYNDYDGGGTPANGAAESGGYHKFGQFQSENVPGDKGFALKGILSLGSTSTAVNFNSANDNIVISDEFLTYDDFTRIEFRNANSNITWTNVTISFAARDTRIVAGDAPATTRGNVESFNNPTTLFLDGCTFADMGTFIFQSNATIDGTAFRRCELVTTGGATFTECIFSRSTAQQAVEVTSTTVGNINNCSFTGDGTSHAVKLTDTINTNTNINWNSTFDASTYASVNATGAGSAGDSEVLLVNVNTGSTLTINVLNGVASPTYRNEGGGSVVVVSTRLLTVSNIESDTELRIYTYTDINDPTTYTELVGAETIGTSNGGFTVSADPGNSGKQRAQYNYDISGGNIDTVLVAHNVNFEFFRSSLTLDSTQPTTFKLFQVADRQYV